jgi:hypothetical protein
LETTDQTNRTRHAMLWIALGVLAMFSVSWDVRNLQSGGSIDFRSRIVGARVLMQAMDPYHYKWRLPEPPERCDPFNNLAVPVSTTTVTPALVMAHMPFSLLPYGIARWLWLAVQWLALLGTAALWMRKNTAPGERLIIAAIFIAFTFTTAWRLHADRGQSYVLLLFLGALWLSLSDESSNQKKWMAGIAAGILITMRLPLAVIVLPVILWRQRALLPAFITGAIIAAGSPMLFDPSCWQQYSAAMADWAGLYRTGIPRPPAQAFPPTIEGLPLDVITRFSKIPFADSSITFLLRRSGLEVASSTPLMIALVVLFAGWLFAMRGKMMAALLPGIAAWLYLVDFFLPAHRGSYNDVQVLGAIAPGLLLFARRCPAFCLTGAAMIAGMVNLHYLPRDKWIINLPTLFYVVVVLMILIITLKGRAAAPAAAA